MGTMATGRRWDDRSRAREASSSSKAPTQQAPRPDATAASRICSVAADVSCSEYRCLPRPPYLNADLSGSAQTTMTTGASLRNHWPKAAFARASLTSCLRTTKKYQGWQLPADGTRIAASRSLVTISGETSRSLSKLRTLCLFSTTSQKSTATFPFYLMV